MTLTDAQKKVLALHCPELNEGQLKWLQIFIERVFEDEDDS